LQIEVLTLIAILHILISKLHIKETVKNISLVVWSLILINFAAMAADSRYTATLAQPLSARKQVIVDYNIWRCEASSCVLVSRPNDVNAIRNCRELKRQVGAVTAYGKEGDQFDSDKLAKCNAT
jgi:hypothetical protein